MAGLVRGLTMRLTRVVRMCVAAAVCTGLLSLLLGLLSVVVKGPGLPPLRLLGRMTGQTSWPMALAACLFGLLMWIAAVGVTLSVIRFVARQLLLLRSFSSEGVVEFVSQTGASVGAMPTMKLRFAVATPDGPVQAMLRQTMDLTRIPRVGETVPLQVSTADPTAIRMR